MRGPVQDPDARPDGEASTPRSAPSRRAALRLLGGALGGALTCSGRALAAPPESLPPELEGLVDPEAFDIFGRGPGRGGGPGQQLEIDLPQLRYAGDWEPRPGALRELGQELRLRTRLVPLREPTSVALGAPELFATPFLYIAGRGSLPNIGEGEGGDADTAEPEAVLRRFVDLGGMIVFDDADGGADRGFARDVEALVERTLPGSKLVPIPAGHVLYRSFYIIDAPMGRTRAKDHLLGVLDEGRIKILVIPNDLGGALARDQNARYRWPCSPGGEVQREWAMRLGVNILLYATCTDYKADRAHVETLLRSRRWK
ncbi:hypothetical protein PPSIR1_04118 [Plesiocystis pacifica SIR-1]|uniref:DUF4159 domain-containing protein n=1 Tax=Plesiocystis pacifica SIR-1 TaxID=391625 RepID=A6G4I2_9BACT|nr:DUF4159 domain-containing protein [Plesiocystis pacifica]EDM79294.1 hypothetical protein PPSIR1_04118 [Plesiocystis pacifica SIR-1]